MLLGSSETTFSENVEKEKRFPDNVFHDVMLQVHVHTFSPSTLFTNPFLILFKSESALFTYCNISFFFQGIRQIQIGTKLQEVGSRHQYEGWTYLHYAMAGANMSYLCEMCSKLFGDIEEDELVPGQFDSPPTKKLRVEAEKEETKVGEASGLINPSGSTTKVYTDQLPISCDLGVPPDYLPHWESVKKEGAKGGQKSISVYTCLFCDHRSQNQTSTITHTCHHLNIVLGCRLCPFTSESTGPLENHIKEAHGGKFLEEQLTDVESTELVTKS